MADRAPQFDEVAYIQHAERLCAGQGFVDHHDVESNYWPVGYPALLSVGFCAFGSSQAVGIGLQIILLALTCMVTSMVGERSFGPRTGRTGALLLALYPNYIFFSTLMLSEPLGALLLVSMAGLLLAVNGHGRNYVVYAGGVGVLSGLLALVRPSFLLLPALMPLWCLIQKMDWRRTVLITLLVVVTALAVMSPWMIRNYNLTGELFEISSNGGLVFWGGNHPEALGGVVRPDSVVSDLGFGTAEYDGRLGYQLGMESIRSDIPATFRRSVQKISYFFAIETDGAMWNYKGLKDEGRGIPLAIFASLFYIAAMATAIFGLVHGLRSSSFGSWFLLLTGYSIAIVVAFEGDPRYHFPLIPFLLMYSALGIRCDLPARLNDFRHEGLRHMKSPAIVAWLFIMTVFSLLLVLNLWLKTEEGRF